MVSLIIEGYYSMTLGVLHGAWRALVGCAPLGAPPPPQVQLWPIGFLLVHKKSPWSFVAFGLRLVLISCDVKSQAKNNNWNWALGQ